MDVKGLSPVQMERVENCFEVTDDGMFKCEYCKCTCDEEAIRLADGYCPMCTENANEPAF